ncbi:hypothetical protein P7C70_g3989, partial [Phenoliferia sp. Uapishka_3]
MEVERGRDEFDVHFGQSFAPSSSHHEALYAFRYSNKPASLDPSLPGTLSGNAHAANSFYASFPALRQPNAAENGASKSECDHWFSGVIAPAKDVDCVLVWDEDLQSYSLERLDSTVKLAHERPPKGKVLHTHASLPESPHIAASNAYSAPTPSSRTQAAAPPDSSSDEEEMFVPSVPPKHLRKLASDRARQAVGAILGGLETESPTSGDDRGRSLNRGPVSKASTDVEDFGDIALVAPPASAKGKERGIPAVPSPLLLPTRYEAPVQTPYLLPLAQTAPRPAAPNPSPAAASRGLALPSRPISTNSLSPPSRVPPSSAPRQPPPTPTPPTPVIAKPSPGRPSPVAASKRPAAPVPIPPPPIPSPATKRMPPPARPRPTAASKKPAPPPPLPTVPGRPRRSSVALKSMPASVTARPPSSGSDESGSDDSSDEEEDDDEDSGPEGYLAVPGSVLSRSARAGEGDDDDADGDDESESEVEMEELASAINAGLRGGKRKGSMTGAVASKGLSARPVAASKMPARPQGRVASKGPAAQGRVAAKGPAGRVASKGPARPGSGGKGGGGKGKSQGAMSLNRMMDNPPRSREVDDDVPESSEED